MLSAMYSCSSASAARAMSDSVLLRRLSEMISSRSALETCPSSLRLCSFFSSLLISRSMRFDWRGVVWVSFGSSSSDSFSASSSASVL